MVDPSGTTAGPVKLVDVAVGVAVAVEVTDGVEVTDDITVDVLVAVGVLVKVTTEVGVEVGAGFPGEDGVVLLQPTIKAAGISASSSKLSINFFILTAPLNLFGNTLGK